MSFGYLDPGTGSFIVQAIIAAGVGVAVALRGYWRAMLGKLFNKKDKKKEKPENKKSSKE